jgi:hypothetical protein
MMADQHTTQFLPASAPVASTSAVAPAPQRLVALPSLAYSTPGIRSRPGLLTAIGVMSIVIAGLSGLASLMAGFQALGFYFMVAGAAARASPSRPAAPSAVVVVNAPLPTTSPATAPTSAPASAGTALTPAEVQAVVQKVQAAASNGLNPAQVTALQAALQDPAQELIGPGTAWSPVVGVDVQPGSAFIHLSGGWIQLDGKGKVLSQFSTINPMARFKIPQAAILLVGIEAVLSVLLAVLLLVAGILVFRRSPVSLRLHRIYAWTKLPLAVAGALGIGWMYGSFLSAFTPRPAPGQSSLSAVFWTWAIGAIALSCGYPIGLLIALRSRQVRAYYNSISGG